MNKKGSNLPVCHAPKAFGASFFFKEWFRIPKASGELQKKKREWQLRWGSNIKPDISILVRIGHFQIGLPDDYLPIDKNPNFIIKVLRSINLKL